MALRRVAEIGDRLADYIYRCSLMKQRGVSMKYMMDFASRTDDNLLLSSARFLHEELPTRIARRVIELENLPHGLSMKPSILQVRDCYVDSFALLRNFKEIEDSEDELNFTKLIHRMRINHSNVVPAMALGIRELTKDLELERGSCIDHTMSRLSEIHEFVDRFYMSRIGLRMLVGQHVAMHDPEPPRGFIGLIHSNMSPMRVVQDAIEDARSACMYSYGSAPDVRVRGDPYFTFPYVPNYLHHMIFELLKNSLRATQEKYTNSSRDFPEISVVIVNGIEDVTIRISDRGGGIPRSGLPKIWTYLYTTSKTPALSASELHNQEEMPPVMAGYGYGLPITRLHARYFGGELEIISMDGYGTNTYLHLNRHGNVQEPLP